MEDNINKPMREEDFEEAFDEELAPTTVEKEEAEKTEMEPISAYTGFGYCASEHFTPVMTEVKGRELDVNRMVGVCAVPNKIKHVMGQIKDNDLSDDTGNADWAQALEQSIPNVMDNEYLEKRISEEGADWHQSLVYNNKDIHARSPNMSNKSGRAQGEAAVLKVNAMLGLGSVIYVPLPHSCMYVAIKVASLSELLDLEYQLVSSKIMLGRYTLGASFSADEATRVRLCVRLVLRHAYASSLNTTDVDTLMDAILVTDYPELLNTMARNLYPKGYEFFMPCLNDPRQCNYVAQGTIDLGKVSFYDRSRFNQDQLKALSAPRGHMTIEQVRKLQKQHNTSVEHVFTLKDNLRFTFKVPTLEQYVESSSSWFQSLISSIDESLELSTNVRNDYLRTSSRLQELCKFHHWIERISWDADSDELETEAAEGYVDSSENIFQILADVSSNEEMKEALLGAITKYISDVTVAIIGIPDYSCPQCGTKHTEEDNKTGIIPINMTNVFTALVTLKLVNSQKNQ